MATRTREGAAAGNERRRGTSPSSNVAAQRRRSPNPPKVEEKKSVPNYLRPTASSGVDASKQQGKKKPAGDDGAHKDKNRPNLGRRASFDRPPSSSSTVIRTNSNPVRAASSSGKTAAVSGKNSRGPKVAGRQQGLNASKKSSTAVKKREIGGGSDTEKEQIDSPTEKLEVSSMTDASEPENFSDNPESPIAETDDTGVIGISDQDTGARDSPVDKHETVAIDQIMEEEEEIAEEKAVIDIDSSGDKDSIRIAEIEPENEVVESVTTEATPIEAVDPPAEEAIQETKEIQDIPDKEIDEKAIEEEEEGVDESKASEAAEAPQTREVATEAENTPPAARVGKKEATVSNDVIEETARQLREQRRNRVRALAGAFETVISLQDPK